MERKKTKALSQITLKNNLDAEASSRYKNFAESNKRKADRETIKYPRAKWMHEAKWGLFTHYLAHTASDQDSERRCRC